MSVHRPRRATSFTLRMPARFLRGRGWRAALAAGGVAVCAAMGASHILVGRSMLQAFTGVVETTMGRVDFHVSLGSGGMFSKDIAIAVARVPGVARVAPVLSTTAFTADGTNELVAVHGFDLVDAAAARLYGVEGNAGRIPRNAPLLSPGYVLVTEPFARRHGLRLASPFELDTANGRQTFTVGGVIDSPHGLARLYDGSVVLMDLYGAQRAFARPRQINRVDVAVRPGHDREQVIEAVRAALPAAVSVTSPVYQKTALEDALGPLNRIRETLNAAVVLGGFIIAFSALSALFEERAWEIGVLRAIGLGRAVIWRNLVLEALLIGVPGVLVGIPCGLLYAHVVIPLVATAAALSADLVNPGAELRIYGGPLVFGALLGLLAAALAAALPAWRATRVEIVETVRIRGSEQATVAAGILRPMLSVLAVVLAVLTIVLEVSLRSGFWGLVAGGFVILATVLLARPVVDFFSVRLADPIGSLAGPVARLAAKGIGRRPRRSARTVALIGVSIGTVFWVCMLAWSFERSVIETLTRAFRADLVVSSVHVASGFHEAPIDERVVSEIRAIPGVRNVAGERNTKVLFEGDAIAIMAPDPERHQDPGFGRLPLHGRRLSDAWGIVAREEGVVASTNFLQNLGRRVGDTITLPTPSGPLEVLIAGAAQIFDSPRGTLLMSRALYVRMWDDHRVNRVSVLVAPGTAGEAVRDTIRGDLALRYGLQVLSGPQVVDYFASQVRRGFAGLHVVAAATLLVLLVGFTQALAAETFSRTRELGAIRVLGTRRRHLRRMVFGEALIVGGMGLVLATASGFAQGVLWVQATFPHVYGYVVDLHIPYGTAALIASSTIGVCLLSAVIPARHALRLEPAIAVRCE